MKTLISAVVVAAALAAPVASFAQSNQPVTRAQVRAELVQLEKAGYNPIGDSINYPANIQAAQARVDAEHGTAQAATSGYGSPAVGTSQSGRPLSTTDRNSVYFGN
jgi:opacity protein-like surface antigen